MIRNGRAGARSGNGNGNGRAWWRSALVDRRLLLPALGAVFLMQMVVPVTRAACAYVAIGLAMSEFGIGVISAVFSLLPVLLAVQVGQVVALRGGRVALGAGAALLLAGVAAMLLWPASAIGLGVAMAVLGIGQTIAMSALQLASVRASGRHHRDSILGGMMTANALGHALGPVLIWIAAWQGGEIGPRILALALPVAAAGLAASLVTARALGRRRAPAMPPRRGEARAAWQTAGFRPLLAMGALSAAAIDLMIVFLPLLATERGIAPETVGTLLILRATASIAVRLVFARLVRRLGGWRLMMGSVALTVAGFIAIALDGGPGLLAGGVLASGLGLGLVGANSLSMTLALVAARLHGPTIAMRLSLNRFFQFVVPLSAGGIAALSSVGAVFACLAAVLACNAATIRR